MWLDKLRKMKEASGLTTKEIALQSQIPEPTLEKLFAGATKDPKLGTISQLVHFFGYTLDDLDDAPLNQKNSPSGADGESADLKELKRIYDLLNGEGKKRLLSHARFLTTESDCIDTAAPRASKCV